MSDYLIKFNSYGGDGEQVVTADDAVQAKKQFAKDWTNGGMPVPWIMDIRLFVEDDLLPKEVSDE